MVATIHDNQRARLPNKVKVNRETCKSAEKRVCTIQYGTTKRKANKYISENGMTNVFLKEYSRGYKIRHNKNQPAMRLARYSLARPVHFFRYLWWQKNGKTWSRHARLHVRVAMEEGLLSVWICKNKLTNLM